MVQRNLVIALYQGRDQLLMRIRTMIWNVTVDPKVLLSRGQRTMRQSVMVLWKLVKIESFGIMSPLKAAWFGMLSWSGWRYGRSHLIRMRTERNIAAR